MFILFQADQSGAVPFYSDPMFWVQLAGVVATTSVAVVAVWLEVQRRASSRYADARERFIVPCLTSVRTIHQISQPSSSVFRPNLGTQASLLAGILETEGHLAYKVPEAIKADLAYVSVVARDVSRLLHQLEQRQNRILDDIGSMLVGDWPNPVQRTHPQMDIMHGNQATASWDQSILEAWINRMRLTDAALFVHGEPPRKQELSVVIRHGNKQVYSGSNPKQLEHLLFQRMKDEAGLASLPDRMEELRLVSEKCAKDLVTISQSHAQRALR